MITSVKIKNFKTLKDIDVPLKPLNLLTGLNGTGKSSFIQALLMQRQSIIERRTGPGHLLLNGHLAKLGTGKDVLYQYAQNEMLNFELNFTNSSSYNFEVVSNSESELLEPTTRENEISAREYYDFFKKHSLFNDNFQYLNAEHLAPQTVYNKSPSLIEKNQIGEKGEFAVHFLSAYGNRMKIPFSNLHHDNSNTNIIIQETEAWLGEISPNIKIQILEGPNNQVFLGYPYDTKGDKTMSFKPTNVGFGISYVLPVIVSLLAAKKGRLIIIENPEAHLHPKGQSRMGRLMALAAQNDVQIIVETHSDHILNGVRVAVKKGEVDPEKVGIYYFQRPFEEREHRAEIIMPKIDKNGRIDQWPEGFFDEWENMLDELII